jgi:hypothetical protein
MMVDRTKYLYVTKQMMDVVTMAIINFISIGMAKLSIENEMKATRGK